MYNVQKWDPIIKLNEKPYKKVFSVYREDFKG
jgi:hypothetical protein